MKKYLSPEYRNEVVMASDVITTSHMVHIEANGYTFDGYGDKQENGTYENKSGIVTSTLNSLLGL